MGIIFSRIACIKNFQIFKILMILKKIKNNLCCDVLLKTKFLILKKKSKILKSTNIFKKSKSQIENKIIKKLKLRKIKIRKKKKKNKKIEKKFEKKKKKKKKKKK